MFLVSDTGGLREKDLSQSQQSQTYDLPAPVVQKLDSAIHRIHHYPIDKYSGTPPYGHLGNTVTSLLRPLFLAARLKRPYIFL